MFGYEKPELIRITEQIYDVKEECKRLEFEMSSLEFHKDYILKRKKAMEQEIFVALILIIPLTIALIFSLSYIIHTVIIEPGTVDGFSLLAIVMFMAFGGFLDYKLIKRELPSVIRLYASMDSDRALAFAKKHDINTIQSDAIRTKKQYEYLKESYSVCQRQLEELLQKRENLIVEQKKEAIHKEVEKALAKEPEQQSSSGFSLKKSDMLHADISLLMEHYDKEEAYVSKYIGELETKLQYVERRIVEIEDEFEEAKKNIIVALIVFLFLIIITAVLQGLLGAFICILCMVACIIYTFYLERKCKAPILNYLIEHDHPWIKEYAFCNNLEPEGYMRKELIEELNRTKQELESIRNCKKQLEIA